MIDNEVFVAWVMGSATLVVDTRVMSHCLVHQPR